MAEYIPEFSKSAWEAALRNHAQELHPGLVLFRFFYEQEQKKKDVLKKIVGIHPSVKECVTLIKRQESQLASLDAMGYAIRQWRQTLTKRLVCGLGIPSLAENGIFLDRILGVPYLPGSALKGVAQDQGLMDVFPDRKDRRNNKRMDGIFVTVFGAQAAEQGESLDPYWEARKGHVIFLDAYPVLDTGSKPFEVDIINPHYTKYYQSDGENAPADYLAPKPHFFLTVRKGTTFSFAVAAKKADFIMKDVHGKEQHVSVDDNKICSHAKEWLQSALVYLGIGGKTRVDYGYFDEPD